MWRDLPRNYAAFSRGHSSVMTMIRAMATETVVDPAMANWRSPIWPTKHTPDNPARDRTDRTGNHKARTRSSSGTDHVGTCGSRDRCDCHDDRDCEHKVAHLISPPEGILLRQLNAQNMTPGPVASPTVAVRYQVLRNSSGCLAAHRPFPLRTKTSDLKYSARNFPRKIRRADCPSRRDRQ